MNVVNCKVDGVPRQRGSSTKISRAELLAAALAIVDAEGVEALTMRRVARQLGVSAAGLYWYVKDKEELLRALVEHVQAPTLRGDFDQLDWRTALRIGAGSYRQRFVEHPRVAALMAVTPLTSDRGWVVVERVLQVLHRAGFSGADLIDAANAYVGYVAGYVTLELAMGGQPLTGDAQREARTRFRALDPEHFPMLTAHAEEALDRAFGCRVRATDLEPGFWFGLERLLDGFEAHLLNGDHRSRRDRYRPT
jgi:TetR/AcrR family transcriptional regulator, tetracycline repressor protein